jgi:hypothetical protein
VQFKLSLTSNIPDNIIGGFGLFDGIWQHTGWRQLQELQERLKHMPELKQMIFSLGNRPSISGSKLRKIPPQIEGDIIGVSQTTLTPSGILFSSA